MVAQDDVGAFAARDALSDEWDAPRKKKRGARRLSLEEAVSDLHRLAALPRYPTPFTSLNDAVGLGGHIGGQVMILAGGTGAGKTTMLLTFANHFANHHGPVLFVTCEMTAGHCVARGAAPTLGVPANALLRGEVSITAEMSGLSPRIEWVESSTLVELRETVEDMTRENGGRAPLVIVDYLQKLSEQVMTTMERPDFRLATTATSTALTSIARTFHAPLLVVSSTSRGGSQRIKGTAGGRTRDPRTMPPGDLVDVGKESSAIEYDAANVLVINVSVERDVDENQIATLTVAKARYGQTQHIAMAFNGPGAIWYDRGRVEPKRAVEVDATQITAERARQLNSIAAAAIEMLKLESLSRSKLQERLHKRRDDIIAAISPLLASGAIIEIGKGSAAKLQLAGAANLGLPGVQ